MRKITQTIVGTTPPLDKNVIWLDSTNSTAPVEKVFINGQWTSTGVGTDDYYTKDEVDNKLDEKLNVIESPVNGNLIAMNSQGQATDSGKKIGDFLANATNEGSDGQVLSLQSSGPAWVNAPQGTVIVDDEMSDISENPVQNKVIKEYVDNNYAKKDGYYSQMTVGSAENLVGQTVDSKAYLIRPTGGTENEVANGVASVVGMEGNSCVWSQLFRKTSGSSVSENNVTITNNLDGSFTINTEGATADTGFVLASSFITEANHKVAIMGLNDDVWFLFSNVLNLYNKKGNLVTTTSPTMRDSAVSFYVKQGAVFDNVTIYPMYFDLTLLGIDNLTTTAQVEEWLAEHVGTKPYYAYNAGTILSAQTLGIKTYGQNLLNPTTKQAKLIPYTWEENSNVYTIKNIPSGATATFTPDATGVAESVTITDNEFDISSYGSGILELSSATTDTYVCMKWNEQKDDDVVPYEDHTYDFDVRKVYGKYSGVEYQCFPNGMRSAVSVHDILNGNEAVVKVGSVDMGVLTGWTYLTQDSRFMINSPLPTPAKGAENNVYPNAICTRYIRETSNNIVYNNNAFAFNSFGYLRLMDSSLSNTDIDSQGKIAKLSGVILDYELAEPITYTDLIYRDNGIDRPLADVLMNIEVNNWSMEEQLMTPYDNGNPTSIPATISTIYGMDAVEQIDTLNKTCYFAKDVKDNLQALLTCINTNCAETLGGTFSIGDPTQEDSKVFTFTFTENTEPDVEPTNEGE